VRPSQEWYFIAKNKSSEHPCFFSLTANLRNKKAPPIFGGYASHPVNFLKNLLEDLRRIVNIGEDPLKDF